MKSITKSQLAVLVTSFLQLVTPGILTLLGLTVNSEKSDPQVTPAGFAFVIWGVITILAFAYGIYQAMPRRENAALHSRLSRGLTIVYILFVCWLIAAITQWLLVTVIIFVGMFLLLTLLFEILIQERRSLNTLEKIILFGQVAIYTGWTTVAIFANTASAIKYYGFSDTGASGIAWQAVILVLALLNGKYWLRKFNRNVVYGATIIWALVGIFFGLLEYEDNLPLRVITVLGLLIVVAHLIIRPRVQSESVKG